MTITNFITIKRRTCKLKLRIGVGKYRLEAGAVKYKLGAGVVEYKLGGAGKHKFPKICCKFIFVVVVSVISRFKPLPSQPPKVTAKLKSYLSKYFILNKRQIKYTSSYYRKTQISSRKQLHVPSCSF